MGINLNGLKVAVIGGDRREPEIIQILKQHGASVDSYGCVEAAEKYLEKPQRSSLQEALKDANVIICPVPLPDTEGFLFAPKAPQKIFLDKKNLSMVAPNACLITGMATPAMKEAAIDLSLSLYEYEKDEDLKILRSASMAEGAVAIAIQHSLVSIHQSSVLIVGFERIGNALGLLLLGMRARLSTTTPLPIDQAKAYQLGLTVHPLSNLAEVVTDKEIIFNTIPKKVFDQEMLSKLTKDVLLVDIAGPPGGVDSEAATELGINFVWARGLGTFGPRTVAKSQWIGLERILKSEFDSR